MNILSFFAVITAVLYAVLFVKRAPTAKGDPLIQLSLAVFVCLGWWAFCDAFFYGAATEAKAWFWLRLGAIGWNGFIPVTAYFFLVMCGDNKYFKSWTRKILYWVPGIIITILFMVSDTTAFADRLVQSGSGLGWTYQQSFTDFWPYLIFIELGAYLGVALIRLYLWQRREEGKDVKILSTGFIILDVLAVSIGILVIYVIPHFSTFLPPLSFIATIIFMVGYWNELRNHDLAHIELAMDPSSVFESSMDAMLITDSDWNILYGNTEAKRMLETEHLKREKFTNYLIQDGEVLLNEFAKSKNPRASMDLVLSNLMPLMASITRTTTRKQSHEVFILSLHDASSLKDAQRRMDYLAHYDELTGLPNRRKLGELLDQWEMKRVEPGGDFAVLFMDLNRFKRINDYYGHAAGDAALQATAEAIEKCLPEGDEAARLAGDEFIVLHAMEEMEAEELAENIRKAIEGIDCASFAPGSSLESAIGVCKYSEAGNVRSLFKLADERMYALKKQRQDNGR